MDGKGSRQVDGREGQRGEAGHEYKMIDGNISFHGALRAWPMHVLDYGAIREYLYDERPDESIR